jgi:hypothetical protein
MKKSEQPHASTDLPHQVTNPSTPCIGEWVEPRVYTNAVAKRIFPVPAWIQPPVVHPVT